MLFLDLDRFKRSTTASATRWATSCSSRVAHRLEGVRPATPSPGSAATSSRALDDRRRRGRRPTRWPSGSSTCSASRSRSTRDPVTASVGVAVADRPTTDADELLRDADIAMYRAKTPGKAAYEVFDPAMRRRRGRAGSSSSATCAGCRSAASSTSHYQPIVDSDGGSSASRRCCAGSTRTAGSCPPREFIPLAEETGLIVAIGALGARTGLPPARHWRAAAGPAALTMASTSRAASSSAPLRRRDRRALAGPGSTRRRSCSSSPRACCMRRHRGRARDAARPEGPRCAARARRLRHRLLVARATSTGSRSTSSRSTSRSSTPRRARRPRSICGAVIELPAHPGPAGRRRGHRGPCPGRRPLVSRLGADEAQGFHFGRPQPADQIERLFVDSARPEMPAAS